VNIGSLFLQRYITKTANVVISGTTSICEIVQRENLCLRGVTKMAENKMEAVAALFGKKLDERFTIYRDNEKIDAMFMLSGLWLMGAYENPYIDVDAFVLMELLNGRAKIVEDEK
jgi:hypothetical protein